MLRYLTCLDSLTLKVHHKYLWVNILVTLNSELRDETLRENLCWTDKPRPVLTVSPSWLSPGASVTLNCEVEHPSAGWSFYWYKAVPDLSEKSSSYELLPDGSGTAQDSYIIHGQTHTAGYVCRAGRGDPEYHTDHSQPKFVWSAGQFVSLCPFNELMLGHHFYSPGFRPLKSHLHDNHSCLCTLKLPKRRTELNIFLSLCDQTKLNFLVSFS